MNPALRDEILAILDGANDMTLATIRSDGYPQATTVSFAHDGLTHYFGPNGSSGVPLRMEGGGTSSDTPGDRPIWQRHRS